MGKRWIVRIYFAPLEGITGYIFRNAYEDFFGGIDCYYSPFVVTRDGGIMKNKEKKDILPEHNRKIKLVPQLLTNQAENFCHAAGQMKELGYEEVNLNLGCPSGTVVSKGRGAGFLGKPEELDRFLDRIFEKCECKISIKTRIGVEEAEEFYRLLEIYNQYPVSELTIHPRTRTEFYKGTPHREIFDYAYANSKNPVCYNGDIGTKEDFCALQEHYPSLESVMIGRGFLARPGFVGNETKKQEDVSKEILQQFMKRLLADYREIMSGDVHALFKMKEIWIYLAPYFTNYEKYLKKIKKTNRLSEYQAAVSNLFEKEELQNCAVDGKGVWQYGKKV